MLRFDLERFPADVSRKPKDIYVLHDPGGVLSKPKFGSHQQFWPGMRVIDVQRPIAWWHPH